MYSVNIHTESNLPRPDRNLNGKLEMDLPEIECRLTLFSNSASTGEIIEMLFFYTPFLVSVPNRLKKKKSGP